MKFELKRGRVAGAVLVAFLWTLGGAWAQQPAKSPPPAPAKIDPQADAVLHKLADAFEKTKSADVDFKMAMKAEIPGLPVQDMTAEYSFAVQKPNRFAMILKSGTMMGATVVSDGKTLLTYAPTLKKYTETNAPPDLKALDGSGGKAGGIGNIAMIGSLFLPKPYESLLEGVQTIAFVGAEPLDNVEQSHLKVTQDELDYDIWISNTAKPVISKVVMDMAKMVAKAGGAPGIEELMKNAKMLLTLNFGDWKLDPQLPPDRFKFTPPEGSTKVANLFDEEEEDPTNLEGQPAPDFKLKLLDGGSLSLAEHKGKHIVILDFWATWCGPCVKALPIVSKVAEAFKDKGVVLFAADQEEEPAEIREFMAKKGWKLNVALDTDHAVAKQYRVQGIPQTVIIDKEGVIRKVHVGFNPDLEKMFTAELNEILQGKSAPKETAK